jgi:hypothetical protein
MVCASERGNNVSLSPSQVFRVALLWGKESRYLLKRNLITLIKYLETRTEKGTTYLEFDGNRVKVNLHYCADLMALDEIFPNDGCPFCNWKPGTSELFDVIDPNKVPTGSLFSLPRKNIRICALHCITRIVENLLNTMLREWKRGSDGNLTDPDLKMLRKIKFEKFINKYKIFGRDYTIKESSSIPVKLTYKSALIIMENYEELLYALEYPEPWEQTKTVWKNMKEMFAYLKKTDYTPHDINLCREAGKRTMKSFIERWSTGEIYRYIHIICSHLWELQSYGLETKTFVVNYSGIQLEAANHVDQRFFHNHTLRGGKGGKKMNNDRRSDENLGMNVYDCETEQRSEMNQCELNQNLENLKKIIENKPNDDERATEITDNFDCKQLKSICYYYAVQKSGTKLQQAYRILDARRRLDKREEESRILNNLPFNEMNKLMKDDIGWKLLLLQTRNYIFGNSKEKKSSNKEKR